MKQLPHAVRAVLRLLHDEPNQVVLPRVCASRAAGRDLARQIAPLEFDRVLATSHWQPDAKSLGTDQVTSAGRQTRWIEWPPNNIFEASSDP
jgi:hypothetical protein